MAKITKLFLMALIAMIPFCASAQNADENLIEIEQTQSPDCGDGANRATVVKGDGYTQYTSGADVSVIIKILDVDVKDCDYILIKFAEGIPSGIKASFAPKSSTNNFDLTEGITEYKIALSDSNCDVNNDILSQITLLTLWSSGKVVKVSGVYKHKTSASDPTDDPSQDDKPQAVIGESDYKIKVGELNRTYKLYVPKSYKAENATPLVFSLHGAGGHSYDKSPFRTSVADQKGCIVVYPQGVNQNFGPFGTVPGWDSTGEKNVDYDFFMAIIEEIASIYNIDRERIYCCGFSNGGMMTYAMTNAAADVFAAFASISGLQMNEFHFRHAGSRPVPFLHIHGKADDFVRYRHMPIISEEMVARVGANPIPTKKSVSGKYDKSVFAAGEGGFDYTYYEIDGMGHSDYTDRTEDGNSSLTMWKHFHKYTLSSPCDTTLKWRPNIEAEGYDCSAHGWIKNKSTIALSFGKDKKTDANENVYRTLSLASGWHKLTFKSTGTVGGKLKVSLSGTGTGATASQKPINAQEVNINEDVCIYFNPKAAYGEYKFNVTRNASDEVNITNIEIHSLTPDEIEIATALEQVKEDAPSTDSDAIYNLSGIKTVGMTKGVYICNGKKVMK